MIDMPVSDFGGATGIGELGVSGKIWKFGVRYKRARVFRSEKRIWRDVKVKVCFW